MKITPSTDEVRIVNKDFESQRLKLPPLGLAKFCSVDFSAHPQLGSHFPLLLPLPPVREENLFLLPREHRTHPILANHAPFPLDLGRNSVREMESMSSVQSFRIYQDEMGTTLSKTEK